MGSPRRITSRHLSSTKLQVRRANRRHPYGTLDELEPRVLLSAALSNANIAGNWTFAGLALTGGVTFDNSGNITGGQVTDDAGNTLTAVGTYTTQSSGTLSITVSGITRSGAVTTAKDLAVITTPGQQGVDVDNSDSLALVIQNNTTSSFSDADLTGAWNLYYSGNADDSTGAGSVIFGGAGLITSGSGTDFGGTTTFTGGDYTVSSTGQVSVLLDVTPPAGSPTTLAINGQLNTSKDVLSLNPTDLEAAANNDDTQLFVAVRRAATYTQADLKGSWSLVGDGFTGTVALNGKGGLTGTGLDDDGDPFTIKGSYTLATSGASAGSVVITATGFPTADGPTKKTIFHATLNASKDLLALTDPPFEDNTSGETSGDSLMFAVKTGDTAPTMTTVPSFGTAVDTLPTNFTYAQLTGSNAADADGDPIQFEVTSLGAGTFTLDDVPQTTTPFFISSGDTLSWTPLANSTGTVRAFSVKAFDGTLASSTAIAVNLMTVKLPTVSVVATRPFAPEDNPNQTGQFKITRSGGDFSKSLTVQIGLDGGAVLGTNYSIVGGDPGSTVAIPAHAASVTLTVSAINDHIADGVLPAILTLGSDPTYALSSKHVATVTIVDSASVISVKATTPNASEINASTTGAGVFTLTRSGGDLNATVIVDYTLTGAVEGTDFSTIPDHSVTFNPGQKTATVTIHPLADLSTTATVPLVLTIVPDSVHSSYFISTPFPSATVNISHAKDSPATIAGDILNATITTGSGPFAHSGTFQFIISPTSNQYVLIGGPTVGSSQGTFTYTQTSPTQGTLDFQDSADGTVVGTVTFSSTTAATFSFTTAGGAQTGKLTLSPAPVTSFAPVSLSGRTASGHITSGKTPLAASGSFKLALSDSSNDYVIAGVPTSLSSDGSYTYQQFSPNVGIITFNDSVHGTGSMFIECTSATAASYVTTFDSGGSQHGTLTFDPITDAAFAPVSLSGSTLAATVTGGANPFTHSGSYQMNMSDSTYTLTGAHPFLNNTGGYTYEQFNGTTGVITIDDSVDGTGFGILTFTSSTKASYLFVADGSSGWQRDDAAFIV